MACPACIVALSGPPPFQGEPAAERSMLETLAPFVAGVLVGYFGLSLILPAVPARRNR